jgi:hypothetical protein
LATIPYPSFDGIVFPRDYLIAIVDEGDTIPLAGRNLLVFKIPDHAVGSLALLDAKSRILFTGDEIGMPMGKPLNGSVRRWANHMEKLMAHRGAFDTICAGFNVLGADIVEQYLENANHILSGHEGMPPQRMELHEFPATTPDGRTIWKRAMPHPGDGPKNWNEGQEFKRVMEYAGCKIIYDLRQIEEKL